MVKTITALLIDPDAKEVKTVELETKQGDISLEHCYKLMNCDLVTFVYFGKNEILICDDEGLLKENNPFLLSGVGQEIYVGKCLVVAERGEKCIGLTLEQIIDVKNKVTFPVVTEEEESV